MDHRKVAASMAFIPEEEKERYAKEIRAVINRIGEIEREKLIECHSLVQEIRERTERYGEDVAIFSRSYWAALDPELREKIKSIVTVSTTDMIRYGDVVMIKSEPFYKDAYAKLMEEMAMNMDKGIEPVQADATGQSKGYEIFRRRKQQNMCPADYGAYKNNRRKW